MSDGLLLGKAAIRPKGQVTLSAKVREALHAREGDELEFHIEEGVVYVRAVRTIAADQAWFWTPDFLAGLKESEEDVNLGHSVAYDNGDDFLKSLLG